MEAIGLYIHVPFCVKKCGYCDFYSVVGNDELMDVYTAAVIQSIKRHTGEVIADTVYFGGGTPSVLGGRRLAAILDAARPMTDNGAEITVEANPGDNLSEFLSICAASGVNRLSIGLQSANDKELKLLTRRHTAADVERAVDAAFANGIDNISLDLMLGIEGQTQQSLADSIDFCAKAGASHVSAYMLKIERETPFFEKRESMNLPNEDKTAELYLFAVGRLAEAGYAQYEISNFAKNGRKSRHNLKYWSCEPYLGIGPSAHSFFGGRRFFYPRDIDGFIAFNDPVADGLGGDFDEYAMLRLRLCEGLKRADCEVRYPDGADRYRRMLDRARKYASVGYLAADNEKIALNSKGFLVSNAIIFDLIG